MKYEKLSKRALYCMYTADVIAGAIALAVVGAVDYFWIFPDNITVGKWISLILAVLILIDVFASPYFRYHRYRYSINEECIDIIEGYLFVKRNIVPIERIHKIQTKKGPIDQLFRVAKVIVTTGGGDVTISFLEDERAEQIADSLRRRINEIVSEQRQKMNGAQADEREAGCSAQYNGEKGIGR
ncbi:MAG TPA: PH domain-containing protein [Candidatus Mediterraneibacter faecavium]|uniref:PH domain-containing protein n=1 Tax=Candidatus Mediterraneibacter faecavium TaxID=2838668 RepID=A0A9D2Q8S2_9FIRM|nr:PH domain-containing protein [Candidatus Mediterraneibacter faecavium]